MLAAGLGGDTSGAHLVGGFLFLPGSGFGEFTLGGDDYLDGGEGNDTIVGDAHLLSFAITHRGGDDTLFGGSGDDVLAGDAIIAPFLPTSGGEVAGGDDILFGGDSTPRSPEISCRVIPAWAATISCSAEPATTR